MTYFPYIDIPIYLPHFPILTRHFAVRPQSGITHSNSGQKGSVSVTWEAPGDLDSDVVFLVSVAQEFTTFWASVPSETVSLAKEPTAEPEPASEPEPEPEPARARRRRR